MDLFLKLKESASDHQTGSLFAIILLLAFPAVIWHHHSVIADCHMQGALHLWSSLRDLWLQFTTTVLTTL